MQEKDFIQSTIDMEINVLSLASDLSKAKEKKELAKENFENEEKAFSLLESIYKNINLSRRAMYKINGFDQPYSPMPDRLPSFRGFSVSGTMVSILNDIDSLVKKLEGKTIHLNTGKSWVQNKTDKARFSSISKAIAEIKTIKL